MNIYHMKLFKSEEVIKHYSPSENEPVKHVFSSEFPGKSFYADIYFRENPHPQFGNRYFGLHQRNSEAYIFDADFVEGMQIPMIYSKERDYWFYSRYKHDFIKFEDKQLDGGRYYCKGYGMEYFIIKNGEFVKYGEE